MGAPSPELSNLWLARAFNEQDVEAAAALYHPEAAVEVQLDNVMAVSAGSYAGRTAFAPPWPRISTSSRTWTW